jgi:hypothetical protein
MIEEGGSVVEEFAAAGAACCLGVCDEGGVVREDRVKRDGAAEVNAVTAATAALIIVKGPATGWRHCMLRVRVGRLVAGRQQQTSSHVSSAEKEPGASPGKMLWGNVQRGGKVKSSLRICSR